MYHSSMHNASSNSSLIESSQRLIVNYCSRNNIFCELDSFLSNSIPSVDPILVVGGFVRDILRGTEIEPRDIDIVLGRTEPRALYQLPGARRNFFGGVTFTYQGYSVDAWPIEDTFHIREFRLPLTVDGLLDGAPFNLDKIAFDLHTNHLYDGGCLMGIANKTISYCPAQPYLEHIQAARAILLHRKTKFAVDESVADLLCRAASALRNSKSMVSEVCDYLFRLKQFENHAACMAVVEELFVAAADARRASPKNANGLPSRAEV
jgi:hypothetical protein